MKVLGFTKWQHTVTNIPSNVLKNHEKDGHGHSNFIQRIIPSAYSNGSATLLSTPRDKRSRAIKKHPQKKRLAETMGTVPILSLTTPHHISIFGEKESRLSISSSNTSMNFRMSSGIRDQIHENVTQVSPWNYTSRPGESNAFLSSSSSSSSSSSNIGTLVDPVSRTICTLQDGESTLVIWNMDASVSEIDAMDGDGDGDAQMNEKRLLETINLGARVVAMQTIQVDKVKKSLSISSSFHEEEFLRGGVAGILENGKVFIALFSSPNLHVGSCTVNVGILDASENGSLNGKKQRTTRNGSSRKKKQMTNAVMNGNETYLHCAVAFRQTGSEITSVNNNESGNSDDMAPSSSKKRSHSSMKDGSNDDDDDSYGDLEITTLSADPEHSGEMIQRTFVVSSLQSADTSASPTDATSDNQQLTGKLVTSMNTIKLPGMSKENGNKQAINDQCMKVTSLDNNNVAVVYQGYDGSTWNCTVIDTRGKSALNSFPILSKRYGDNSGYDVLQIGGISSSIMAVLSSDDVIRVYDAHRAVILHELDIHQDILSQDGSKSQGRRGRFSIATSCDTGTICVIRHDAEDKNDDQSNISLYFAKAGMFDRNIKGEGHILANNNSASRKCSLASIISSSLSTSFSIGNDVLSHELFPVEMRLDHLYPDDKLSSSKNGGDCEKQQRIRLSDAMKSLEKFRGGEKKTAMNGVHRAKFYDSFIEIVKSYNSQLSTKEANGHSDDYHVKQMGDRLPQSLIDTAVSVAIDVLMTDETKSSSQHDAMKVLIACMKSEKVSCRKHFDRAVIRGRFHADEVLNSILQHLDKKSTLDDDLPYQPLLLISNLLQHCQDSIPEYMLVSMLHFVLCHVSRENMEHYWERIGKNDSWHHDTEVKLIEKRLDIARKEKPTDSNKEGFAEELNNLVGSLEKRLFVAQQVLFADRIVSYSRCNAALLRIALKNGQTQVNRGEVEVCMKVLGKLLRKAGRDTFYNDHSPEGRPNRTACITEWIGAMTDVHLETLCSYTEDARIVPYVEQVQKGLQYSIKQGETMLRLKTMIDEIDDRLKPREQKEIDSMELKEKVQEEAGYVNIPRYSVETLTF